MKAWLDRWRISRALDDGTPLPADLQRRLRADAELSAHHEKLQALGRALGHEARAWRETAGAERPELRAEILLARAPRTASLGSRRRLRPVLVFASSAAAAVLALFAVRALRPDTDASADMQRAAAAAHESGQATVRASAGSGAARGLPGGTPWSRLDHLAKRTSALSPSALGKSGEQALLQEARNVARDAAQVATHLAERVPFARAEPR